MGAIEATDGRKMGQTAHEGELPVCTGVQRGAGFFNKIKILEESVKAIPPHYLTKVRDAEFHNHIKEVGEIRNGMI